MKVRGFSRIISDSDDKHYWLTHAEYNQIAEVTKGRVLNDTKAAASTVSDDYEIVVTEGLRTWHGLKLATAAEAVAY